MPSLEAGTILRCRSKTPLAIRIHRNHFLQKQRPRVDTCPENPPPSSILLQLGESPDCSQKPGAGRQSSALLAAVRRTPNTRDAARPSKCRSPTPPEPVQACCRSATTKTGSTRQRLQRPRRERLPLRDATSRVGEACDEYARDRR